MCNRKRCLLEMKFTNDFWMKRKLAPMEFRSFDILSFRFIFGYWEKKFSLEFRTNHCSNGWNKSFEFAIFISINHKCQHLIMVRSQYVTAISNCRLTNACCEACFLFYCVFVFWMCDTTGKNHIIAKWKCIKWFKC